ncbi:hypothetical protein G6F57_016871 [Rhizopus arrhizus]|nr:hypothetical protein G6F57_016871 [Rhizopus arrhizus]
MGQQGIEADDLDIAVVAQCAAGQLHALFQRQRRALGRALRHADHDLFEQRRGPAHQVDMTIGDRIERSGIDGNAAVGHGHGRMQMFR